MITSSERLGTASLIPPTADNTVQEIEGWKFLFFSNKEGKDFIFIYLPDMQGVRMPSPRTMDTPTMVVNNREYLIIRLLSSEVLRAEAIFVLCFGKSNL